MRKANYREALDRAGVLAALAAFDPHVAGTPPLALDLPESDIDVLCHAPDAQAFAAAVWSRFRDCDGFAMNQWIKPDRPVVARFRAQGWTFELFGQARPVQEQIAWRHFCLERKLLALGGPDLRAAVMDLRRAGRKTEPAFAAALELPGDPYAALLDAASLSDEQLAEWFARRLVTLERG